MNIHWHVLCGHTMFPVLLGVYLGVKLLGQRVILCYFEELFSKPVVPFISPQQSMRVPISPHPPNTCYCWAFLLPPSSWLQDGYSFLSLFHVTSSGEYFFISKFLFFLDCVKNKQTNLLYVSLAFCAYPCDIPYHTEL
jgi:hypothetical protein